MGSRQTPIENVGNSGQLEKEQRAEEAYSEGCRPVFQCSYKCHPGTTTTGSIKYRHRAFGGVMLDIIPGQNQEQARRHEGLLFLKSGSQIP